MRIERNKSSNPEILRNSDVWVHAKRVGEEKSEIGRGGGGGRSPPDAAKKMINGEGAKDFHGTIA